VAISFVICERAFWSDKFFLDATAPATDSRTRRPCQQFFTQRRIIHEPRRIRSCHPRPWSRLRIWRTPDHVQCAFELCSGCPSRSIANTKRLMRTFGSPGPRGSACRRFYWSQASRATTKLFPLLTSDSHATSWSVIVHTLAYRCSWLGDGLATFLRWILEASERARLRGLWRRLFMDFATTGICEVLRMIAKRKGGSRLPSRRPSPH
jgi:hypothetical protein